VSLNLLTACECTTWELWNLQTIPRYINVSYLFSYLLLHERTRGNNWILKLSHSRPNVDLPVTCKTPRSGPSYGPIYDHAIVVNTGRPTANWTIMLSREISWGWRMLQVQHLDARIISFRNELRTTLHFICPFLLILSEILSLKPARPLTAGAQHVYSSSTRWPLGGAIHRRSIVRRTPCHCRSVGRCLRVPMSRDHSNATSSFPVWLNLHRLRPSRRRSVSAKFVFISRTMQQYANQRQSLMPV